jgi:hypothetical protein
MTHAVSEYCFTLQSVQYILIFWISGKVAVRQFLRYNVSFRATILLATGNCAEITGNCIFLSRGETVLFGRNKPNQGNVE